MKFGDTKHPHAHKDVVVVVGEVIEDNIVQIYVESSKLVDQEQPTEAIFPGGRNIWLRLQTKCCTFVICCQNLKNNMAN